jgi:hypothetical protein
MNRPGFAFCIKALEEALARLGWSEIFQHQPTQPVTSPRLTGGWHAHLAGGALDGQCVYRAVLQPEIGINTCMRLRPVRNSGRTDFLDQLLQYPAPHSLLAGRTPDEAYRAMG